MPDSSVRVLRVLAVCELLTGDCALSAWQKPRLELCKMGRKARWKVGLCKCSLRSAVALCTEKHLGLFAVGAVCRPANLVSVSLNLWIGGGNCMESKEIPGTFIQPGQEESQGYFVLAPLFGTLTTTAYSLGSGAHPATCGLSVSTQ